MDRAREWFKTKQIQQFRDNLDLTTGAVTVLMTVGLFMGATGFNLEGAAGVIIGELPSEIVDVDYNYNNRSTSRFNSYGGLNAMKRLEAL